MVGIPARCERCGHVFASPLVQGFGATINFSSVGTPCPKCGANANIVEGSFHYSQEGEIDGIIAPPLTHKIINELRRITENAKQNMPSEDELLASVQEVSPELAEKISPLLKKKGVAVVIYLILLLLSQVNINIEIKATLDLNKLFDQVVEKASREESSEKAENQADAATVNVDQSKSPAPKTERQTKRQAPHTRPNQKEPAHTLTAKRRETL
jgi:hypothetical protein